MILTKIDLEDRLDDLLGATGCDLPDVKWTTQDGEKMTLGEMRMKHLRNAIKAFRRQRKSAELETEHYRKQIEEFPETEKDFADLFETAMEKQERAEFTEYALIQELRRRLAEKRSLTNSSMLNRVRSNLSERTNRRPSNR